MARGKHAYAKQRKSEQEELSRRKHTQFKDKLKGNRIMLGGGRSPAVPHCFIISKRSISVSASNDSMITLCQTKLAPCV